MGLDGLDELKHLAGANVVGVVGTWASLCGDVAVVNTGCFCELGKLSKRIIGRAVKPDEECFQWLLR